MYEGRLAVRREGSAAPHGRERARVVLLGILAAVIYLSFCAAPAYAQVFNRSDEGGYVSGTVGGYGYTTYGRQQALAEFLGYDWSSFSTTTQSAIMSAGNNDNAFRSALEQTKNVMYETQYSGDDGITAFQWPLVSSFAQLFGYDHLWDIKLTRANYEQAQEVVKKYAFSHAGNDDNESGFETFPVTMTLSPGKRTQETKAESNAYFTDDAGNKVYVRDVNNITFTINWVGGTVPSGEYDIYAYVQTSSILKFSSNVYLVPKGTCEYKEENGKTVLQNVSGARIDIYRVYPQYGGTETLVFSGGVCLASVDENRVGRDYVNAGYNVFEEYPPTYLSSYTVVTPPYTPMPEPEPEPPDQPIAPTPPTNEPNNTVQEPGNVTVTVKPNFDFDFDVYGGGTADFSGVMDILELIYDRQAQAVNDISSAIDGNVLWLHDELRTFFNNTGRSINQQLVQVSQNIDGYIDDAVYSLENYLHNQLTWLAKELKYVAPGESSNADIIYWLKRIYFQLGGSQERPLTEDGDAWLAIRDWIHEPYQELIDESPEISGEIRQKLDRLKAKFPFSIPWDILELVQMFQGEAVTPSFRFTMPLVDSDGYVLEGDLHAFDDAMVHVRTVELIAFTGYMLWNTPRLLELLDVTKGKDNG